ncbi:MAG: hypothetical protein KAW92_04150 [Candidatus Cloacimonetes bacterium]|nr:hypothetical protein [Candidatus Cloacimonadota bacterium]
MKFKITLTLLLIFIAANLSSASLLDRDVGSQQFAFSARSLSMGSVGIASKQGILSALNNPATLGLLHNKFRFTLTANVTKNDEDRAYPIYDSFDSYIDDAVYVSNAHIFDKYFGGLYYNWNLASMRLTTAFNFASLYDFNFKYEEEMRNNEKTDNDNEPKKIANNIYKGNGEIYAYSPEIALTLENENSLISSLSFGIGISYLNGENKTDSTIIFTDWAKEQMLNDPDSLRDTTYTMKNKYSGIRYQGGFIVGLGERVNIGFSYTHKTELTKEYKTNSDTVWADTTIYYPTKFGIGFEYHPRNVWDTKFSIEARLVKWSDYNDSYYDVIEYSAGVEHIMHNGIPIRLGFRYQPSGRDEEVTLIAFSAGTSINLPYNLALDLGAEIGKINYNEKDLFPDSYYANENLWDYNPQYDTLPEDRKNYDKIKDFMINAMATISWRF